MLFLFLFTKVVVHRLYPNPFQIFYTSGVTSREAGFMLESRLS